MGRGRGLDLASQQANFEQIAMPHLDAVYRMARQLARNTEVAEDLVQETFLRAFRAFGDFQLRDYGAKPWLLKILHNAFYTNRSKEAKQPRLMDELDFDNIAKELEAVGPEELTIEDLNWDDFDEEIKSAVDSLQPEYRTVVLIWSLEGLSYKEIAEVCHCPVGTVMSRLYRARRSLGQKLAEYARQRGIPSER